MKHFHDSIQGWFVPEAEWLYRWRVEQAPAICFSRFVEVGCWKGRSAAFMAVEIANSEKPITLYCVDHWKGSNEILHKQDPDLPNLYKIFRKNLKDFPNVIPMRMNSVSAASAFEDGSLDFVFIDASHEYRDVCADINAWTPKIKSSGILAGDDWGWPGVKKAVQELAPRGYVIGNVWYTGVNGGLTPPNITVQQYA